MEEHNITNYNACKEQVIALIKNTNKRILLYGKASNGKRLLYGN